MPEDFVSLDTEIRHLSPMTHVSDPNILHSPCCAILPTIDSPRRAASTRCTATKHQTLPLRSQVVEKIHMCIF